MQPVRSLLGFHGVAFLTRLWPDSSPEPTQLARDAERVTPAFQTLQIGDRAALTLNDAEVPLRELQTVG
ncbi:hypothetical protein GCM10025762_41110 [Haloechinothrix salitolerans]